MTTPSSTEPFFAELDETKRHGRGSCCMLWSFLLLWVTLFVLGAVLLVRLLAGGL